MRIRKMNIDGHEIMFVNQFRNTRNGFAHDTTLFIDNREYQTATCHYYNRTWEWYDYQTVMLEAVYLLKKAKEQECKREYLRKNSIKQIRGEKRKAELTNLIAEDEENKFYDAIMHDLKTRIA